MTDALQPGGAARGRGAPRTEPSQARTVLARLDRIPVWSLPASYLVIIGVGYFFTFFDIADIGYGMPAIVKQFHLSSSESTFVALSVGLIGYAVGSIAIGALSDRFGRFKILLLTIGLTALGSFLDATATNVAMLALWRFVTGMGVGADLNLVSTYLGELAPAARFELPESPRWLALHGREDEADAIVRRMEDAARAKGVDLPEPRNEDVSP